ncbi:MAG: hypothetical protein QXJ02_00150 [Candidatus Bathyarchaeia archaeon]
MSEAITMRLKSDKRAVSNVIVVMLSLVLIVVIVGNVVLWSYQMNQLDIERMQEKVQLTNVTRLTSSSWFTAQNEFTVAAGSKTSGTFADTRFIDGSFESFREEKTQSFNPQNYVLGGSTKHVAGTVTDLASDDSSYMSFRSYPNYEIRYQESLSTSITASTTYQDKIVISFTPQATANFFIIATAEVQGSSTSYQTKARLTVNSSTHQELLYRVKDTSDWYPFCALKRISMTENTNYEIKIQYCTSNTAATSSIRNARLIITSLSSEYAESEPLSTTASTVWQDKMVLSLTPPADGEYLLIASANYMGSSTNYNTRIRLLQDDTTVHVETTGRPGSGTTANYYTFGVMRKVSLDASPHTFKIQYCTSNAIATAGINHAHILAVRLDQFDNTHYAESEAESAPAAPNTWYDKVTNTYLADAADYLIIGSLAYASGSASYSVGITFQASSSTIQSPLVEHRDATTYESAFFMTKQALSGGSTTDKLSWMGESTSARVRNARLISCKLPVLTQTAEIEFVGNSNTQNWTQLEWTIDSSYTTADVATTFQLYNYQTSQYPTSGDGYLSNTIGLTDVTTNQTITSDPNIFRDAAGGWKIKIKGVKSADTPFELKVDWVEFKATTSDTYQLNIANSFLLDTATYPLDYVNGIELLIRYNVSEDAKKWFLKMYNWTAASFSDTGFNSTSGSQPITGAWNEYAIQITDDWKSYVNANDTVLVQFYGEGTSPNQTLVGVDFVGVRAILDGACFELKNSSPFTTHVVSIWLLNATYHQRYVANFFVNSGETATYIRVDIRLPKDDFIAKVTTEKGNVSIFP